MARAVLSNSDGDPLPVDLVRGVTVFAGGLPHLTDAFGRLRVSAPETVFGSKQTLDATALVWDDQQTSGAGTGSVWADARSRMSVSNLTAGKRVRQTFRHFDYQPGKAQQVMMTFVFGTAVAGITRRIGQFDANDGIFLEQSGTTQYLVVRKAGVENRVARANWSEDGGFPELDFTKAQILFIDYEWLGVGSVRIGFVVDGEMLPVHHFHHSNVVTAVYMATPVLPLRAEIENDGTGPAATMDQICAMVASEGGTQNPGIRRSIDRAITGLVTLNDSGLYPLLVIRKASTKLRSVVRVEDTGVLCTSSAVFRWALLLNPTFAGTAPTYAAVASSVIEAAVGTTNATKVTDGTLIASGYADAGNSGSQPIENQPNDVQLGSTIAGVSDVLVLAVQRITGTTETFYGHMSWRESQ